MTTVHVPAQRPAPRQSAPADAPVAVEQGWGVVARVGVARASLAVVACLVLWSVLPLLAGWTPRVILSGSMEPRVHVGDVIITREVPATSLAKGQILTVTDPDHPGKTRTHRMLRTDADGRIVLKGDANREADSTPVAVEDVLGVGVVRVPYVGRPAYWLAERNWLALGATGLFLGWCVVTVMPGSRREDESDETDEDDRPTGGEGQADQAGRRARRDHLVGSRRSTRRRVAATVALTAVAVSVAAGPAEAAFKRSVGNPLSRINAASTFYPYRTAVLADSPFLYWKLDETSGTAIADSGSGNRPGTMLAQTFAQGQAGALLENPNKALGLTVASVTATASTPAPAQFSVEAWVRTTSTTGGRILGLGNANGMNPSTTVDRQLYLAPNGKVYFGIGSAKATVASAAAVNDGAWHHVVGTYTTGNNGMKLYVDGVLAGQTRATTQTFDGYWRAGAEDLNGWAGNPTDDYFEGTLDELAVYTTALSAARVQAHRNAGITP